MREKVLILKWWQMWTNESLPGNLEILLKLRRISKKGLVEKSLRQCYQIELL